MRLAASQVGIVGLGGTGSQIAQALAYLGVGSFVLVDDDYVEDTNLNRLVGAGPSDVYAKTLKTSVAERLIRFANPRAAVQMISRNLRSRSALSALMRCPIIFGCVDHDAPRLILSELAAAYELTLIDVASEIRVDAGRLAEFGGRVIVARPGEYCIDCAGQLDREQAKWELSGAQAQEAARRHGYGLGDNTPAPAVVSLNGVVANLAVTEFLMMATGIREVNRHVTYYGLRGRAENSVTIRADACRPDCYICGYLVGKHEQADIYRYALAD